MIHLCFEMLYFNFLLSQHLHYVEQGKANQICQKQNITIRFSSSTPSFPSSLSSTYFLLCVFINLLLLELHSQIQKMLQGHLPYFLTQCRRFNRFQHRLGQNVNKNYIFYKNILK